jgi:predicted TIM-barrel fold metal-dependent hydrolase
MKIIALEEHFTTAAIQDANADHPIYDMHRQFAQRTAGVGLLRPEIRDLGEKRLAAMDAAAIDVQVLSQTAPATENLDPSAAVRLAKESNDTLAEAIRKYPARFSGFATLPMPDPTAAANELERAVTSLGLVGAMVNGHVAGRYLDDEIFWPVFERAEALDVPIYLHPNRPPQPVFDACYSGFPPVVSAMLGTAAWGWHIDTGLHVLRLILGGVFDRFPGLQMIIGHMGEALPSMMWRADWGLNPISGLDRTVKDYFFEHFYVTTSGIFDYPPFVAAVHAVGIDRILFSVDYPYSSNEEAVAFLNRIPISREEKEKIAHANSERVLKL